MDADVLILKVQCKKVYIYFHSQYNRKNIPTRMNNSIHFLYNGQFGDESECLETRHKRLIILIQRVEYYTSNKLSWTGKGQNNVTQYHYLTQRHLKWVVKTEVIYSFVLFHCCRWTCMQTYLLIGFSPNNESLCSWNTYCAILELAVVWVARWGEGRGFVGRSHFAVWRTACGWTFWWEWGIGGITETQSRK